MRLSRRRVIWGVVALVVLVLAARFVVPTVALLVVFIVSDWRWFHQAAQGRKHLFFETDYQELLAACRTLSKRTVTDGSESRSYFKVYLGKRDPETLSFPPVILDLKPARIFPDLRGGGEVYIELMPGPDSFGVMAFPEGSEGKGNVKLIEGLWYFDTDYHDGQPEYMARIDDMLKKGRQLRAGRAGAPARAP